MKMTTKILLPGDVCQVLRKATPSPKAHRPDLLYVLFSPDGIVATNGHVMIVLDPEDYGYERADHPALLVHRDILTLARPKSVYLSVDMATREIEVNGRGPQYPIRLPPAILNAQEGGTKYPDWARVMPPTTRVETVVGMGPKVLNFAVEAAKVLGTGETVVLGVNDEGMPGSTRAVRMTFKGANATGLLMPMRVIE